MLYKGTITRLITEDSACRAERERDEALSKGQVVYEGVSGHILTYDREYISGLLPWPTITVFLSKVWHKPNKRDSFSSKMPLQLFMQMIRSH